MRFVLLRYHRTNCMAMPSQSVYLPPHSDIPNPCCAIPTASDKHTQILVNFQTVNTAQMAMVVSNYFVHFQIPTFHRFVLAAGKQIGVLVGKL